jgi:hypothetical protein
VERSLPPLEGGSLPLTIGTTEKGGG